MLLKEILMMKRMAILSVIAGMGLMPHRFNPVFAHPVHAEYAVRTPKAKRNRKNTGSGVIKAKRLARKAKNRK